MKTVILWLLALVVLAKFKKKTTPDTGGSTCKKKWKKSQETAQERSPCRVCGRTQRRMESAGLAEFLCSD